MDGSVAKCKKILIVVGADNGFKVLVWLKQRRFGKVTQNTDAKSFQSSLSAACHGSRSNCVVGP